MSTAQTQSEFVLSCPIPIQEFAHVTLAHGGGGKLTNSLISKMLVPTFDNPFLDVLHDGATVELNGSRLAFSTDSFVVQPLFFPGGDIGSLAIHGTVNDLAMCGARPLFMSVGFVLEEGLPMETLWRIVQSMQYAAHSAGVSIVTGDTKVVDRGKGDGIFINTSGIGVIEHDVRIAPDRVSEGDVILVSGDIGRHGMAIMATREGLEFESAIESDSASLVDITLALLGSGIDVHCLRDLTRGGLATALVEIAESASVGIQLNERAIPVREDVRGACELLGFDPLYVANEGRFAAFVGSADADRALALLQDHPDGLGATIIGTATSDHAGMVTMTTRIGGSIVVDMLSGEQLPRIC